MARRDQNRLSEGENMNKSVRCFNAQHGDCKILVRNGEVLAEPLIVKQKF